MSNGQAYELIVSRDKRPTYSLPSNCNSTDYSQFPLGVGLRQNVSSPRVLRQMNRFLTKNVLQ